LRLAFNAVHVHVEAGTFKLTFGKHSVSLEVLYEENSKILHCDGSPDFTYAPLLNSLG
jgi:hypothetical protein